MRPLLIVLVLFLPRTAAAQAPPGAFLGTSAVNTSLQSHAEAMSWSDLTPHEGVGRFYRALDRSSPHARTERIGESREGRDILMVTIARPAIADADAAHASGKPIVLIVAQVHGDEPAGKEGLMLFARDLAHGELQHLLDDVVFVLVPLLNPDGAAFGAWGRRTTDDGRDLNRDYLRLEHPEIRTLVERVIVKWRPHVVVDAHELSGPAAVHDFFTLAPDNVHGPELSARFTRERAIPAVVRAVEEAGYSHRAYQPPPDDPSLGFSGGSHGARALTTYAGAHGAVSILYETLRPEDARIGIERRARIHRLAFQALGRFVAQERREVTAVVEAGREEMIERGGRADPQDSLAIRYEIAPAPGSSSSDAALVTLARVRPVGYAIEGHREDLALHLARHGLRVERTLEPIVLEVERFHIDSIHRGRAMFEGVVPQQVWTTARLETLALPAGSFIVPAGQSSAALLFHLLEPEDGNSWASAGAFDGDAAPGHTLPAYRLLALPPPGNRVEMFP